MVVRTWVKSYWTYQTELFLFTKIFIQLAKLFFNPRNTSQNKGKVQIYKVMRKSHNKNVSMNLRFMQKYVNVHTFIFISLKWLKYHIHYTHACFLFHAYLYFWFLGSQGKSSCIIWVMVQTKKHCSFIYFMNQLDGLRAACF